ncbi:putative periplasmic protein [Vibrio sinaloensis DSM 21326]|uniref:Putative periplasmic protein n=1 Tax=Vibrio sinaloensis DSM 21326 TaxID=945550 RepID=E8M9Z7_PHOS4|nr:capsule biosynthesis GfcC family protein [Vibrio sinaloensis]EGA69190.1 putative periplasmic protein [Vibrio sinaloensis DSM 21326]
MTHLITYHSKLICKAICLSFLAFIPSTFATAVKITLPADNIALEYQHPVRLEQVINDIIQQGGNTQPSNYPLANQLFNLDKQQQVDKLKKEILLGLKELVTEGLIANESAGLVIEQVENWDVVYRELIELDFDTIRTQPSANPMLQGNLEFISPKRSQELSFEGLLFPPQKVPFDASQPLSEYFRKLNLLSNAHPSYAWIIYPNGHFVRAGYAYWNEQKTQLTPGSAVFIGFNSEDLEIQKIEERIVQLISMRKSAK